MSTINVALHCYMHGFADPCPICEGNRRMTQRAVDAGREQRRYEIARDVFSAMAGSEAWDMAWDQSAEVAVKAADALLRALEESGDA